MKNRQLLTFFTLLFFVSAVVSSCDNVNNSGALEDNKDTSINQDKAKLIDELISTYAEYGKFNGAVLVAKEGEIIYKKGFGFANVEWDILNDTDTKFRLASVSKQFTAMLTVQLFAEKNFDLDTPISTYLPDYPKENGDKITIHHLLTHSSGIPNYTSFPNYRDLMKKHKRPKELVELFADSALLFTPGERFSYSNSGYVLLGVIIEEISGKSIEKVLQEKILTPLKMNNTGFDNSRNVLKNRAIGYDKNGSILSNTSFIDMSVAYTAGGIYSTVEDLFLWDQALYTEKLLPKKNLNKVFEKHISAWGEHYSYGWIIGNQSIGNTEERIEKIEHDGVINGFTSSILRLPSDHSSIIFLNNTGGAPLSEMNRAICGILYDKPYDFPKNSMAHALLKIVDKEGIEKGIAFYEKVKKDDHYYLSEDELNMASYHFLQSDRAVLATEILKIGIDAYPNAFNLYDSYGEVLLSLGDTSQSIKYYTKSLSLNPKNENAIQVLEKLGITIDKNSLYLLKTDESWTKEIFIFPIHFAQGINYEGIEEAQFPPGWRKTESPDYWTYVIAWNVNLDSELTKTRLENELSIYFDGLMDVVNKDKSREVPPTIAHFQKIEGPNTFSKFTGSLEVFDAFITNEVITLNTVVEQYYCQEKKKSIIYFKFSPQDFGDEAWMNLNKIKLRDSYCEE
jgi:CubicO group peptidase (beta-lactamase class C family)